MTTLVTTCPRCDTRLELATDAVLAARTSEQAGEYAFLCPVCNDLALKPADARTLGIFAATGVTVADGALPPHPESPPSGPALTTDDLLDLHLLLEEDRFLALISPTRS